MMESLALFMSLFGIAVWILIALVVWRAMRAHEKLAESHEKLAKSVQDLARRMQSDR